MIPGHEADRLAGHGNFQERLIIRVRQGLEQRRGSNRAAPVLDMVQQGRDLLFGKFEFRPAQNFGILQKNTGIETK